MKQYHDLLKEVIANGVPKNDRTGTGTISLFAPPPLRFNMKDGFPLVTTKKMPWNSIVTELLWFLRGDTNTKFLHDNGCTIWDEWANESGNLGPIYGHQWRKAGPLQNYDQLSELIHSLTFSPDSRRHIVNAWQVDDLSLMALPPCHMMFQCYVANGLLSLHMYQRSADLFLGVPFNIASYALLLHILAGVCNYEPHELIISFGDAHIYSNHTNQVAELLRREPLRLPTLYIDPVAEYRSAASFNKWHPSWFTLYNYNYHSALPAPVAV